MSPVPPVLVPQQPYLAPADRLTFYRGELLRVAPRILSQLNRCPLDSSAGSLDREYWAWATKEFANLDLQRGLLPLGYLYRTPFDGNPYHGQPALLTWIKSGVAFWLARQDRAGSFDHLYIHEGSWMATAFTLVDMLELRHLLGEGLDPATGGAWLRGMIKAGEFLCRHDETHGFISNHRAGAAAGLLALHRLTGTDLFRQRAEELLAGITARQHGEEGWYLEYEGSDPGYQTLDFHYQGLCHLYRSDAGGVPDGIAKALEFQAYFIHPDGSVGGEYGSRGCPHFFPGGFEVFSRHMPLAEAVAGGGAAGLAAGRSCGVAEADCRNEVVLATSYVLACRMLEQPAPDRPPPQELPCARACERVWPAAGLYIRSEGGRYLILGAAKGGVVKLYRTMGGEALFSSCGYVGQMADHVVSTLFWTTAPRMTVTPPLPIGSEAPPAPRQITVTAPFYRFRRQRTMHPLGFLAFRVFNHTLGRLRGVNAWVRTHLIIGLFLKQRRPGGVTLCRTLDCREGTWRVEDTLWRDAECSLPVTLREMGFLSTVYMASARYYRPQDLIQAWEGEERALATAHPTTTRRDLPP